MLREVDVKPRDCRYGSRLSPTNPPPVYSPLILDFHVLLPDFGIMFTAAPVEAYSAVMAPPCTEVSCTIAILTTYAGYPPLQKFWDRKPSNCTRTPVLPWYDTVLVRCP